MKPHCAEYAVIPLDASIECTYTDSPVEAAAVFAQLAMCGKAVGLGRLHKGRDKPTAYYDTIDTANI